MQIQSSVNIAVLLTCHNRRNKTVNAINSIKGACEYYNAKSQTHINIAIFLTDDGCTDNTSEVVREIAEDIPLTILKADGNAFWAGGMRLAWEQAINYPTNFDFYLLINDDTTFKEECFFELYNTHIFSINTYRRAGVYSGFISGNRDESDITYGAKVYKKSILSKAAPLLPNGKPQECSMVNANFLLVSNNVVEKIGILDDGFIHAAADMDYSLRAKKAKFPVLTTSHVCGYCKNDHDDSDAEQNKVIVMPFKERKTYLNRPNIKQYHDSLEFYWRYDKIRWILFGLSYILNLYIPTIYYKLYKTRGH